ncbi:MAG: DUF58 domain-containing protein [Candidatus Woesearchaeota archaeon]|nr:MAG: DUF58 domain-containing protein [Candidatus Woesearchaeota archaeon]
MELRHIELDLEVAKKHATIAANRDMLIDALEGDWSTSFKGQGMEFAGYRAYQFGDDASLIDWKVSLRSNKPLVKEFEVYRNFRVFILLDVSDSMLFSSTQKLKVEYAAEVAYVLADAILRSGDAVGFGMFSDGLRVRLEPNIGPMILQGIKHELHDVRNYGGPKSIVRPLKETLAFLNPRGILILISDFIGLEPNWTNYIRNFSQFFSVIGIGVRDPRDRHLPKDIGQLMVENPSTNEAMYIDTKDFSKKYEELVKKDENSLNSIFTGSQGDFIVLETNEEYFDKLITFFRKRLFKPRT